MNGLASSLKTTELSEASAILFRQAITLNTLLNSDEPLFNPLAVKQPLKGPLVLMITLGGMGTLIDNSLSLILRHLESSNIIESPESIESLNILRKKSEMVEVTLFQR